MEIGYRVAGHYYRSGVAKFRAKEYQAAIADFERAVSFVNAGSLVSQHHKITAEQESRLLLGQVYLSLGDAQLGLGGVEVAISSYRSSIVQNPHIPEAHYKLGVAVSAAGNYAASITPFYGALVLCSVKQNDRLKASIYFNLGVSLLKLGSVSGGLGKWQNARNLYATLGDFAQTDQIAKLIQDVVVQQSSTQAKQGSGMMDDSALIQAFVEGSTQGEATLLSNPNLRTEPAFNTVQLLAKKEGLLASAKLSEKPQSVSVKRSSSYWKLIHQVMLVKGFFPVTASQKEDFYSYQYRTVPAGYQVNCTTGMELYQQVGWGRSQRTGLGIPMDLLILSRGAASRMATWHPVQGLICSRGSFYVKTLGSEIALGESDLVVWLKKNKDNSPVTTYGYRGVRPDLRGYYRPKLDR